jgi:hypothetical protein
VGIWFSKVGVIMRQIAAAAIAIVVLVAVNSIFESATPLLRIVFAALAFSAAWVCLLWKDLMLSAPEHPDAHGPADFLRGVGAGSEKPSKHACHDAG